MANNDMKQIKFDMLVKDIYKKMIGNVASYQLNNCNDKVDKFKNIYGETTPLCIFFDTKSANYYRKSIFLNDTYIFSYILQCGDVFPEETISDNRAKKIYLTKALIELCRFGTYFAADFVFWSLLAACVDKTDYYEKISMIADFAHAANIDENVLFDITQIIKIVLGKERENTEFRTEGIYDIEDIMIHLKVTIPLHFEEVLSIFKK